MFWLVFWILVCVAILAYGIRRMANHDYRFGSGLFKSSDSNLDEKDEFVDKDYCKFSERIGKTVKSR